MSDEPLASPAVPPPPAADADDYDVIYATLVESARGRQFLQEHARRARQADTMQVLAAITRLEGLIRERSEEPYQSFRGDLVEMATAIAQTRTETAQAQGDADNPPAGDTLARDEQPGVAHDNFATAERIKDIAWTMRERGFDLATCDQIEQLASSILSAAALRDPHDGRAQRLADVLGSLERRINAMLANVAGARTAPEAAASEHPVPPETSGAAPPLPVPPEAGDALDAPPEPPASAPAVAVELAAEPAPPASVPDNAAAGALKEALDLDDLVPPNEFGMPPAPVAPPPVAQAAADGGEPGQSQTGDAPPDALAAVYDVSPVEFVTNVEAQEAAPPADRLPVEHLPEPHLPESHLPESHLPEPHLPESHLPEPPVAPHASAPVRRDIIAAAGEPIDAIEEIEEIEQELFALEAQAMPQPAPSERPEPAPPEASPPAASAPSPAVDAASPPAPDDPLAALKALSDEERIALFT